MSHGGVTRDGVLPSSFITWSSSNITINVATTGSDTTGTGTADNPYATIQKGTTEAARFRADKITIKVDDGTYTEEVTIPSYALGKIVYTGNTSTPGNVIWDAGTIGVNTALAISSNNSVYVILDGFHIQDSKYGVDVRGQDVEIGYVEFDNNTNAINANNGANVYFETGYTAAATIDGNAVANSTGVVCTKSSNVMIKEDLTITDVNIGIICTDQSGMIMNDDVAVTLDITLRNDANNNGCILIRRNSYGFFASTVNLDGVAAGVFNSGIQITNGSNISVKGSTAFDIQNFRNGIQLIETSTFVDVNSSTYNYAGNTRDTHISHDSVVASPNDVLSGTNVFFDGFEGVFHSMYGFDRRYLQTFYDEMWNGINPEWATRVTTGAAAAQSKDNGWYRLTTGATGTNEESIDWNDVTTFTNTKRPTFECNLQLEQITNMEVEVGLTDGLAGQSYIRIYFDASAGNAWNLEVSDLGATTSDAGAVATNTETALRFEFTSDTTVRWSISTDGGIIWADQGVVSTNVPTANLQPYLVVKTEENTAHYCEFDYVILRQDRA